MIAIIVAIDRKGGIGRGGDMLYHLRADLRRFKRLTTGNTVVMGRKTFESLPGGALKDRRNIVITSNEAFAAPGVERASNFEEAITMASEGSGNTYIIGGSRVYGDALPTADVLELTVIDGENADADTFFPAIPLEEFEITRIEHADTEPAAKFITLRRKNNGI